MPGARFLENRSEVLLDILFEVCRLHFRLCKLDYVDRCYDNVKNPSIKLGCHENLL